MAALPPANAWRQRPASWSRRRSEWAIFLAALILSFLCVISATYLALLNRPDRLEDTTMLAGNLADYGREPAVVFGAINPAILEEAATDEAGLRVTVTAGSTRAGATIIALNPLPPSATATPTRPGPAATPPAGI